MSTVIKRPPLKETVGAQYMCFDQGDGEGGFAGSYAAEVEKTQVVKTIKVSEISSEAKVRASGIDYSSSTRMNGADIEVETVAFPAETLSKARGDKVTTHGLILSGGHEKGRERPFFAYGKVVMLSGGHVRFDWYPKCQLVENSDETKTSEESFSEQNDTFKIHAYPFVETGDFKTSVDSTLASFPEGMTEEKFFAKPILTDEDLTAANLPA